MFRTDDVYWASSQLKEKRIVCAETTQQIFMYVVYMEKQRELYRKNIHICSTTTYYLRCVYTLHMSIQFQLYLQTLSSLTHRNLLPNSAILFARNNVEICAPYILYMYILYIVISTHYTIVLQHKLFPQLLFIAT